MTTTIFDDDGKREFLTGFLLVAFVLGVFGAGLELGAASAGEPLQVPLVATLLFGSLTSGGWIAANWRLN